MNREPSRLLIVRLGSMGDIIHTLPAVAALRRAFPAATIGWLVEQRWSSLLSTAAAVDGPRSPEKPLVDVVHAVDTLGWRAALLSHETWREARIALRGLREGQYEIAIDFQGAWKSAILAQLSRAPRRLGFLQPREKPATLFYTHEVAATGQHIVEQNLSLAEQLCGPGLQPGDVRLSPAPHRQISFPLPRDPAAEATVDRQLRAAGLHSFAIITPGAGWGAKCWPAERYGKVVRALSVHGLRSVVNFGPGEEELARAVVSAANDSSPGPVALPSSRPGEPALSVIEGPRQGGGVPLAVALPTTVSELIALTRRARLFIGGDTGPTHLAAALGVPLVALFGPTDPARNGPYAPFFADGTGAFPEPRRPPAIVLRSGISRTTTSHRREVEEGLLHITAAQVIAAARQLLASEVVR